MTGNEYVREAMTMARRRISHGAQRSWSVSRYDAILLMIPLIFAICSLSSILGPVSFRLALATASLIGALCVLDALFVHPPSSAPRERGGSYENTDATATDH